MWRRKAVGWPQARPEWCHPSCHLRCSTWLKSLAMTFNLTSNEAQNIIQCPKLPKSCGIEPQFRSPPPAPSQVVGAAWGWAQSCWASSWCCFLGDVPIVLTVFLGFSWFLKWCFLDVFWWFAWFFGDFPGKCFLNGVSLVLAMIYTDSHWFSLMTCTDLHCLSLVHMFFLNTALHWLSWIVLAGGWLSLFFFVRGEVRGPKWSDCHVLFIPFGKWGAGMCWWKHLIHRVSYLSP